MLAECPPPEIIGCVDCFVGRVKGGNVFGEKLFRLRIGDCVDVKLVVVGVEFVDICGKFFRAEVAV